jgi:hypothetical protein
VSNKIKKPKKEGQVLHGPLKATDEDDAIVGDLDAITFNPIAASILKWLKFRILRWMQYLHHSALLNNGLG